MSPALKACIGESLMNDVMQYAQDTVGMSHCISTSCICWVAGADRGGS